MSSCSTCYIKCPSIRLIRESYRSLPGIRIERCHKSYRTVDGIHTYIRHTDTAVAHVEETELGSDSHTSCNRNIQVHTGIQIGIQIASENCIYSRFQIVVRILVFLSIPMFGHYSQTAYELELHLEMLSIDGIK